MISLLHDIVALLEGSVCGQNHCTGCLVSLCQNLMVLICDIVPVRNVIGTWVQFSKFIEMRICEI
jgi:hypothetical protein